MATAKIFFIFASGNLKQLFYDVNMIKGKGRIRKYGGVLQKTELREALEKLKDNEDYEFLIVDMKKNNTIPCTTYLFSVVLPQISQSLPDHPTTTALYKYFEDLFAPPHTCTINGQEYEYWQLKDEKASDVDKVIEKIIQYAKKEWNIDVVDKEELRSPENREFFASAYKNQETDWGKFLSAKLTKKHE